MPRSTRVTVAGVWLVLAMSPAWSQSVDGCPKPARGLPFNDTQLSGRALSRKQLTWCMGQARSINAFLERATKRRLDLERVRILVALKRHAERPAANVGDAERRFRQALHASRLDIDALTAAGEMLDIMETYDVACAGRPYDQRGEAAVQRDLRLPTNPMRSVPYPAAGRAPERDDHLRSSRPALTTEEQTAADTYHQYLVREIVAFMRTDDPLGLRGQVRVKLRIASSGALASRNIVTSSGDSRLDDAVLAAVERAQPYCPPPYIAAHFPIDIVVTVAFAGVD